MRTVIAILALALCFTLIGCPIGGGAFLDALANLDIADAVNLVIQTVADNGLLRQVLTKQTEADTIEPVEYRDANDRPLEYTGDVTAVINVNADWLIVEFDSSHTQLVRKTDGAVFSLDEIGSPAATQANYYTGQPLATDAAGNIYFISKLDGELQRIDVGDPTNITATVVSATGDTVGNFAVDGQGNVAYYGHDSGDNQILRVKKASGGLELLPGDTNCSHITFWIGLGGELRYYNGCYSAKVQTITVDPTYAVADYGANDLSVGCGFMALYTISDKDSIIAPGGCSFVHELDNASGEPRAMTYGDAGSDIPLTDIKLGGASDNYYYLAGTSAAASEAVLWRIDPADDTRTQVLPTAADPTTAYDLYKMTVSPTDVVVFNALRLSDGAIVLGRIGADGAVTIMDATLEEEVVALERIR